MQKNLSLEITRFRLDLKVINIPCKTHASITHNACMHVQCFAAQNHNMSHGISGTLPGCISNIKALSRRKFQKSLKLQYL